MIKERINMELRARIILTICISSLILYLSVEGLNILPSITQPNSKLDPLNPLAKDHGSPGLTRPLIRPLSPTPTPFPSVVNPSLAVAPVVVSPLSPTPGPVASPGITRPLVGLVSPTPGPVTGAKAKEVSPPIVAPVESPSGFFDHDVALVIEARIRQSQTDSQLAIDEAKRLLDDREIASSGTGMCLGKCVEKYAASLEELNRAIKDLGVRDVALLAGDFGAVEQDISSCQACFSENIGEDSPMKGLEEATTKAARECLTVMDYAV